MIIGYDNGRVSRPAPIFSLPWMWHNVIQPEIPVELPKVGERFWCPGCEDYRPDSDQWEFSKKHDATVCPIHRRGRKPKTTDEQVQ